MVFGVLVTAFGASIGLTQDGLSPQIGAVLMIVFGVILIVPMLANRFEAATAGMAARADTHDQGRWTTVDCAGSSWAALLLGAQCGHLALGLRWAAPLLWRHKGGNLVYAHADHGVLCVGGLNPDHCYLVLARVRRSERARKCCAGLRARSKPISGRDLHRRRA